jgi:tRNA(Ile)-lysidine synthase TilS/MesJ
MKQILGKIRRADSDFNMIQNGDRIAVGLSGGKDSMLLLRMLKQYQRFCPHKFELYAITINMGLEGYDPYPLVDFCKNIEVPYRIIDTHIGELLFEVRKEKSPCSLCANMRRGALHNAALDMGCNKVALGHHLDDAIETFIMSLFYEGRINTFSPVTYLSKKDLYLIRPFIFVKEKEVIGAVKKLQLPIVKNPCPANGFTKRQYAKELIKQITRDVHDVDDKIISAIMNVEQLNIWDKEKIKQLSREEV